MLSLATFAGFSAVGKRPRSFSGAFEFIFIHPDQLLFLDKARSTSEIRYRILRELSRQNGISRCSLYDATVLVDTWRCAAICFVVTGGSITAKIGETKVTSDDSGDLVRRAFDFTAVIGHSSCMSRLHDWRRENCRLLTLSPFFKGRDLAFLKWNF